jgi:hypothetical protein
LLLCLLVAATPSLAGPAGESDRLRRALEILEHVPTGRELLGRAQKFWDLPRRADVREALAWGRASKTDAVLTRHFDPKTGAETRERQVTIYLKQNQPLEDLVLDLAHELVHATSRPTWDPYDPHLTAGRYVWAAIEGEGGEVGPLSADLVRREFYRVGRWHPDLARSLGAELKLFPHLSPETPKLYSSTGNAPYPASLVREFHDITQIACANSRRRVTQAMAGRSPASSEKQDSVSSFLAKRCAEPDPK